MAYTFAPRAAYVCANGRVDSDASASGIEPATTASFATRFAASLYVSTATSAAAKSAVVGRPGRAFAATASSSVGSDGVGMR